MIHETSSPAGGATGTPGTRPDWRSALAEILRRDPVASRDPVAEARFERLRRRLEDWLRGRSTVHAARLLVHADGLVFLVIPCAARPDEVFEEALSALDVELACESDFRFRVDVLSLPRGADPREVLQEPLLTIPVPCDA